MSVSQLKPEEQMVIAASKNLSMGPQLFGESEFSFVAANNCSVALQRGFYFSLRMPDWAKDFKHQTQKILSHEFEGSRRSHKSSNDTNISKFHGDHRSERYGVIFSESSAQFFENIPREMQVSNLTKSKRSPKIKDDLTCGKKVPS
ncbi:uncharacterized protein LOC6531699 [Drosophila yakuba]|uniref:Uncharacterized protein n=1 Tax=Drosophila yakuba TaxID=7245 RepID=A0A0R1DYJ6_DROYA|nr:uncharacterized protein LOC6531699 [Drosophila yakuba]KRK00386.1 uncharacterized protein Dyak_GE14221 [Drosophila yakuba]